MKRIDYLKLALQLKLYAKKAWLITAFSVTKASSTENYPGKLIPQPWGYTFVTEDGSIESIDDAAVDTTSVPLFNFKDPITIDNTWASNVTTPIVTTVGNVLFNAICIVESFGSKHSFTIGRVSISKLEDAIAKLLKDTPSVDKERSTSYYYVDEYIRFVDSLQFISTLTQIATVSATRKTITAPTGLQEFKAGLIKKYDDTLNDPVVLARYEAELLAFDDAYMQGDPANNTFVAGKIKHTARKKMFLSMGAELQFSNSQTVVPITNSLKEGWPTDKKRFTAAMNGLRVGSFSRGAETVKGGVSAKYLLRAANNFKITDTDCGSKLGVTRLYTKDNVAQLEGRYLILGPKLQFVETVEQANGYIGSTLTIRSPMYCKLKGDNICKICAGNRLAQYPNGLTIPLTEISAIILAASLKLMHVSSTTTAKLRLAQSLS